MDAFGKLVRAVAALALLSGSLMLPGAAQAGRFANGDPCDDGEPGCISNMPEPETILLLAIGAAGLVLSRRRKK